MKAAQPGRREELLDAIAPGEAPLEYAEPGDEVTVERDEDMLRSLKHLDDFA